MTLQIRLGTAAGESNMSRDELTTACECSEPGWCERHACHKSRNLHRLSRTRDDYFQLWEDGGGADQSTTGTPRMPSLTRRVWNLAQAMTDFVADGLKTVEGHVYETRLQICNDCDQRCENRCLKCGCNLALKARGRAFDCPLNRWPPA